MAAFGSLPIPSLVSFHCKKNLCFSSSVSFCSSFRVTSSKPSFKNPSSQKPKPSISSCLYASGDLEEKEKREKREGEREGEGEVEEYRVLTAVRSEYNEIMIVDTATSRFLLLDSTHNVHSILNKGGQYWTGSYWDEFATLPAIIPKGPIAIYGLGGGTAARLMLDLWPSLQLEGWEIDGILIEKARDYLGLSDLENPTQEGGRLYVHVDDAFSPSNASASYAGIIIDLFSDGKVLTQLQKVSTWLELSNRLMPKGRIMVNCGGRDAESDDINREAQFKSDDTTWTLNYTIKALSEAFPGQVSWKQTPETQGQNFLALTGPLPDLTQWSNEVPNRLSEAVKQWKLFGPFP